jgi:hypothetical protein
MSLKSEIAKTTDKLIRKETDGISCKLSIVVNPLTSYDLQAVIQLNFSMFFS